MKGTIKPKGHTETQLIHFDTHRGLFNQKRINVFGLRKTSLTVKTYQLICIIVQDQDG